MNRFWSVLPAAILFLAGCASSGDDAASAGAGASSDAAATEAMPAMAYVGAAGASDLFEIRSSQVALQRATNPDVRAFAQMMVEHHTQTTADLTAAARQAGLNPPPPALTPDKARMLADLQRADAGSFDRLYMQDQVAGHQEALALHRNYQANGDKAPLRAAAAKTVPIVTMHLDRARELAGRAGG